jgi:hypothetical protein
MTWSRPRSTGLGEHDWTFGFVIDGFHRNSALRRAKAK